jgi:hypothetical protein
MPDAESVATKCLQAWTTDDFETAASLTDEDISFVGPSGAAKGADTYLSGLRRFQARGIQGIDIRRVFSDGDHGNSRLMSRRTQMHRVAGSVGARRGAYSQSRARRDARLPCNPGRIADALRSFVLFGEAGAMLAGLSLADTGLRLACLDAVDRTDVRGNLASRHPGRATSP